jgi:hypothetical protein
MHPASDKQKRYFFVLCADLGYSAEEAKERAKTKYKLEHFNDIQVEQLSELIELLVGKLAKQNKDLSKYDADITAAGHEITVCASCGSECIVTDVIKDVPLCTRITCIRRFYAGLIK